MPLLDPSLPLEAAARQNFDDSWSPAVRQDGVVYYWPNITMSGRDLAALRAQESIDRMTVPEEMLLWNVWPDTNMSPTD